MSLQEMLSNISQHMDALATKNDITKIQSNIQALSRTVSAVHERMLKRAKRNRTICSSTPGAGNFVFAKFQSDRTSPVMTASRIFSEKVEATTGKSDIEVAHR